MAENVRILLKEEDVDKRIAEVAAMINRDYAGKEVHLICILRRGADRKGSGRIHCGKECADRGGHHRFWPDPGLSDRDLKAEEPGVHSSVYAAG